LASRAASSVFQSVAAMSASSQQVKLGVTAVATAVDRTMPHPADGFLLSVDATPFDTAGDAPVRLAELPLLRLCLLTDMTVHDTVLRKGC
jgi:hypothetical protein